MNAYIKSLICLLLSPGIMSLPACQATNPSTMVSAESAKTGFPSQGCNDQPENRAIKLCLNLALDGSYMPYFKRLFAKAWSQNLLPEKDGWYYLAAALQYPDAELLKFLLEQGLTFPGLELSQTSPGQLTEHISRIMSFNGFKLEKSPSPQVLDALFKDKLLEDYRLGLAWWLSDWAVRHYDSALIEYLRQKGLKLVVRDVTERAPLELDVQISLIRAAFEAGNLDYLLAVNVKESLGKLSQYSSSGGSDAYPQNFANLDISRITPGYVDMLLQIKAGPEREILEKLLRVLMGENAEQELNLEGVRYLRAKGVALTLAEDQRTPLMLVAGTKNADLGLFLELAAQGQDIHAKDKEDKTALFYAAEAGQQAIADWLLAQGAQSDIRSKVRGVVRDQPIYESPLLLAVIGGSLPLVERLLPTLKADESFDLIATAVTYGHSHLITYLAQKGQPVTIGAFRTSGAKQDSESFRLLFNLQRSAPDLDSKLMEAYTGTFLGSSLLSDDDLPAPGYFGESEELRSKQESFQMTVLETGFSHEPVRASVWHYLPIAIGSMSKATDKSRLISLFRQGLQAGISPNRDGENAIINAASFGELELLRELVAAGADLKRFGNQALQKALEGPHITVVEYLLNQSVPLSSFKEPKLLALNLAVPYFSTPLAAAIAVRYFEPGRQRVIDMLASKTNLSSSEHQWLPFLAVYHGDLNFLKRIAQYQDIKRLNQRQENLFFALGSYQTEPMATYLKSQGLDINAVNVEGDTALHSAVQMGRLEELAALLALGANVCILDKRQLNVWERVQQGNHFEGTLNQPVLQKLRALSEACPSSHSQG